MTIGGFGLDMIADGSGGVEHLVDNIGQFTMMVGELGLVSMATVGVLSLVTGRSARRHPGHEVSATLSQSQFDTFWIWYSRQDGPSFHECYAALDRATEGQPGVASATRSAPVPKADHWWIDANGIRITNASEIGDSDFIDVDDVAATADDTDVTFEGDEAITARLDEVSHLDLTATQTSKIGAIRRSRSDLIEALRGIPETDESRQMVAEIVEMWNTRLDEIVAEVNARGIDRLRSVRQYVADIDTRFDGLDLSKIDTETEAGE